MENDQDEGEEQDEEEEDPIEGNDIMLAGANLQNEENEDDSEQADYHA